MNLNQIKKTLEEQFSEKPPPGAQRQILFWYDEEGQFVHDIDELVLANARILKLHHNNAFQVKYQLEKIDLESNYLLYASFPKPAARDNWLLDILKYSREFSTDKAALIMRDLGVKDTGLLNVFRRYLKFFENKERYRKLASYNLAIQTEEIMHAAVVSALCRLPLVDFEMVIRRIFVEKAQKQSRCFKEIESFGDLEAFWEIVEKRYGYPFEKRSLDKLLLMFLVTHLGYKLKRKLPATWQEFLSLQQPESVIFVESFMNHIQDYKYYDALACWAEGLLKVKEYIEKWDLEDCLGCDTFRAFDQTILTNLRDSLLEDIGEFSKYRKIIDERRTSHWFGEFSDEYEALYHASKLLEAEKEAEGRIAGGAALELIQAYAQKYYLVDQHYRKFYYYYDRIEPKEPFAKLADKIENSYVHWFLSELSINWSKALADELLDDYSLAGVGQQYRFFRDHVAPHIKRDERVFVIISDGLRYEAGQELHTLLQNELQGKAELSFLQGVVPSTTKVGMASLLPGEKIEIGDQTDVLKEGISTQGTENRRKVLDKYSEHAVAIQYRDMVEMKRADYKETFEGKKLVYIYHNVIDAVGDDSTTEREVFQAAEKALQELLHLVRSLVNHISATNIYITADHGFIYRRSPLQESDKVSKEGMEIIEGGRRYLLTSADEEQEGALPISMKYLLGESKLKAVVPRGVIRYKIQGPGANYVHGGASLQEIVIPLIKFKYVRREDYRPAKVTVKLTNISRKITNRITYLEFLQVDRVGDKKLPLRLKLYFEDEAGQRISNENIIIADSSSSQAAKRAHREKFTLKELPYDKNKPYYLIMEDEEEPVEKIYKKIPFVIDLLISDDFIF